MIDTMVETMLGPLSPLRDLYAENQLWINTIVVTAAVISIFRRRFTHQKTGESSS